MNEKKQSFLRNHADTLAIIGVNIAIGAVFLSILLSNISAIASANARIDTICVMIHSEMKDFHGRLCAIEERNRGKNE